jgi:hypothetical protein
LSSAFARPCAVIRQRPLRARLIAPSSASSLSASSTIAAEAVSGRSALSSGSRLAAPWPLVPRKARMMSPGATGASRSRL